LLKENENPPVIWPEDSSIRSFEGQWWVVHTRSRNEKALANDLKRKGVSYFLPMTWKVHHYRGRKMRSFLPLFSGYLFFCGIENDRLQTLKTNRVANLIEVLDSERFINELEQIEQAIRSGAPLTPHDYIKAGQKCRVTAGPMANLQGIVIKTRNAARLVLQIDMLGQAASVEIDTDIIEVIDEGDDR